MELGHNVMHGQFSWMNDPRFALLAQMKRFTFANAKFVLGRGMKELKLGNAFPVAPAILGVVLGAMLLPIVIPGLLLAVSCLTLDR